MSIGEPQGLHCDISLVSEVWHVALMDNDMPISKSEFETFDSAMDSIREDLTKEFE